MEMKAAVEAEAKATVKAVAKATVRADRHPQRVLPLGAVMPGKLAAQA
jgi:hypothetical protein